MKKVIIIGGGMAGLSAGCYLQMNGYDTEIFEMDSKPGGLCSFWERKGYTIDGCINWFIGCSPGSDIYSIWDDLIDIKNFPFVIYDEFVSFESNGRIIHCYGDIDKFADELKKAAPEDMKAISDLVSSIRWFASLNSKKNQNGVKPVFFRFISDFIRKVILAYLVFVKWPMPVRSYVETLNSGFLKKFFNTFFEGEAPMWLLLSTQSFFCLKDAGYPIGGSREVVKRTVKRYCSLGGKINCDSKVSRIAIEDDVAKGIVLENGAVYGSDIVISAADGYDTIFNMLEGRYRDRTIRNFYNDPAKSPKSSGFYFIFGLSREFDDRLKVCEFFELRNPISVDGEKIGHIGVTVHNFNPLSAPAGKTLLTMHIISRNPGYWINLRRNNKAEYDIQKSILAESVLKELEWHFGNIKDHVEMSDVVTPATFFRYTNNWNGSIRGWTDFNLWISGRKKEISGLKDFYMCGQWVDAGYLSSVVKSGMDLARKICKRDKKAFVRSSSYS